MTTCIRSSFVLALVVVTMGAGAARAQRTETTSAFERFEEGMQPMVDEGSLSAAGVGPILLVGATPAFEQTRAWFPTAALESLIRLYGANNVRLCESCMSPRVHVDDGRMELSSALSLTEIARLDADLRGEGAPARTAVWIDETAGGIAVRIVSIENAHVLFAGNFDGVQRERTRTANLYNATLELGRRLRGDSLTHIFIDAAIVPNQHISLDIAEQFGDGNKNLAGITFSAIDPLVGVGVVYYRVIPAAWNLTIGAQGIVSVPTAVVLAFQQDFGGQQLFDPLFTGVLVARMPIPHTSFAVVAMVSSQFRLAIGITLLNTSFLPFVP